MPTSHRRINVTCDPELAAALEQARPLLAERSDAARVRALALAGARALREQAPPQTEAEAVRARLLAIPGIQPATKPTGLMPWFEEMLKQEPTTKGSETLEWVRGGEERS